jgi:hypothetical protein
MKDGARGRTAARVHRPEGSYSGTAGNGIEVAELPSLMIGFTLCRIQGSGWAGADLNRRPRVVCTYRMDVRRRVSCIDHTVERLPRHADSGVFETRARLDIHYVHYYVER